jgi:phosphoribosyl-ATP pyrophosphohydrolase
VLYANEVSISDVMAELERRQSRSGIAEKASRQN